MANQHPIPINSEQDLRKHAGSILRRIGSAERNGLLFLLNPVLALRDAGFELSIAMRRHIKRALRYGSDTKRRLRELEEEVSNDASRKIHLASNVEVARLLFDDLGLAPPVAKGSGQGEDQPEEPGTYESELETEQDPTELAAKLDYAAFTVDKLKEKLEQRNLSTRGAKDDLIERLRTSDEQARSRPQISLELLEAMQGQHPVVPKLIEARKLLREGWQFVNRQTYERVKAGATVTLLRGVTFKRGSWKGVEDSTWGDA